jgi:hypothetical protein
VTLRGKHKLRVFENRVLRRIFEPRWRGCHEGEENGITRSCRFVLFPRYK